MTQNTNQHIDLSGLVLKHGSHSSPENGMCAMEASAYFAGEPHSFRPACVDPAITSFVVGLNDRLGDDDRQKLAEYTLKVLGTRGTDDHTKTRGYMAADWAVRVAAPARFEKAGKPELAAEFRALPEVTAATSADVHDRVRDILAREHGEKARYWSRWASWYEIFRPVFLAKYKPAFEAAWKKLQAEGKAPDASAAAAAAAAADASAADAAAAAAAAAADASAADAAAAAASAAAAAAAAASAADAASADAASADAAAAAAAAAADASAASAAAAAAAAAADASAASAAASADAASADFSYGSSGYWQVRKAVYGRLLPIMRERFKDLNAELLPSALELLDRMIAVHKTDFAPKRTTLPI